MTEILAIRLNSASGETIPWVVWSPAGEQVIASGNAEHLMQVSAYSKDREVIILADSTAVNLLSVPIPPGGARQLENILPFLLEDDLAQDVFQVHISLLDKTDDIAHVAVIEHKIIQEWLSSLAQADLHPKRIIPDCLCLPEHQGFYSAVMLNDRWLVRTSLAGGFAAETAWLSAMLTSIQDQKGESVPKIKSYSGKPAESIYEWLVEPAELVMELLARGIQKNNFTLLTGRYKPTNHLAKYSRYLKEIAVVAVLLLSVLAIEQIIHIHRIEKEVKAVNAQIMKEVKKVLPQNKKIPTTSYLRRVLEEEASRLSSSNSELSLLNFLARIGPMLKSASNIELHSLRYEQDKKEIRFDAKGKDFADFEKLRAAFSEHFTVELGRLNKDDKNIVTGAFVLKKE